MKRRKGRVSADREKLFALADVFADAAWRQFLAGIKSTAESTKKSPKKASTAEAAKRHRTH